MHLYTSLSVLALAGSALAEHGHAHLHPARQVVSTSTVVTTATVFVCPCELSSSTLSVATSETPSPVEPSPSLTPTTLSTASSESTSSTVSSDSTSSTSVLTLSTTSTSTSSTTFTSTSTTTSSTSTPSSSSDWSSVPSDGEFSRSGFGTGTTSSGSGDTYVGNVGSPYGSNIIEVSSTEASNYKYVVKFEGSNTEDWLVVIWNKIGPDGKMDGWYENACHNFTLAAGATKLYAFDADSQGGWAAAAGDSIPLNDYGSYASTWGEFDFGSSTNSNWSGFDVSAIQAQNADLTVQGMKICSVYGSTTCSSLTAGAATVDEAYTSDKAAEGGIGGNLSPGAVRLAVTIDYSG
ncbi:hypothetical protein BJX99DRAFT_232711 [Aspergillus californicus]